MYAVYHVSEIFQEEDADQMKTFSQSERERERDVCKER